MNTKIKKKGIIFFNLMKILHLFHYSRKMNILFFFPFQIKGGTIKQSIKKGYKLFLFNGYLSIFLIILRK